MTAGGDTRRTAPGFHHNRTEYEGVDKLALFYRLIQWPFCIEEFCKIALQHLLISLVIQPDTLQKKWQTRL